MLLSVALMILMGLTLSKVFKQMKMPPLIGLLVTGIILGPYVFNVIDQNILNVSVELRKMALVVILLRAGLSLKLEDMKTIGKRSIFMAFIPATFEFLAILVFGPLLLPISYGEAAILGSIIAAVSPAVVVPRMIKLMEEDKGQRKKIPQLVLSAASLDDVYVIILFTSFLQAYLQGEYNYKTLLYIPLSIVLGVSLGLVVGFIATKFFKMFHMRDTIKVLILFALSFLALVLENVTQKFIAISGLLTVMVLGGMIRHLYPILAKRLVIKFEKIWVIAEMLLFILVGAAVDINTFPSVGLLGILLITIGLISRMIGVMVALIKSSFTLRERVYIGLSYIPKATVQAAIGGIPLAYGVSQGYLILAIAVLSIIVTAPLGAFAMDYSQSYLLNDLS